jgi:hypothetical protein
MFNETRARHPCIVEGAAGAGREQGGHSRLRIRVLVAEGERDESDVRSVPCIPRAEIDTLTIGQWLQDWQSGMGSDPCGLAAGREQ